MLKIFFKIASLSLEYKYWMILAALMGFFTIGSGIGLMMTSAYIISSSAILTPIYQLQVSIVGVRFFGISRGVFRYLERYISHEVTFKLLAKLRLWLFKALEPLVPSKKINLNSGDLLSRSIEDIESLEHIFVRVISPPFIFVAVSVLMFTALSLFSLKYAVIFLVIFIGSATGIPLLTYLLGNKIGKQIVILKSHLKEFTVDYVQGMSELIIYGQTSKWKSEFEEIENKLLHSERKMLLIQSLHENLTGLAMNAAVAVLLFSAIPDVNSGALKGVYLAVITIGIMASFEIVFQIPTAFQFLSKSIEAGKRLLEITEQKSNGIEIVDNKDNEIRNYNLKVCEISFSYGGEKKVLNKISFEIKENQKIAVVGVSGSGKSTIVNILTKMLNYDQGDIFIGGVSYKKITEEKIRQLISVVPQSVHLFTGTIKENLLIAKDDASDDELYNALEKAQLINFVKSLPDVLDTYIGELGKKLSGGESKRLAVARALLRNSPIIFFDEATSHLDTVNEKNILKMIEEISKSKSVLFVTHRLTQMEMFDNIIVLSDGKIIETGKHSDLIINGILYKKMINSQNSKIQYIN
jgi:ATP-binding cassette subfamily C protein CydC